MKKRVATTNVFLEMKEEYSKKFNANLDKLHSLEDSFVVATGYYPMNPSDVRFNELEDYQQRTCAAFWNTEHVRRVVEEGKTAFALSSLFFDCFADTDR